jgi:hypothetical protein
MIFLSFEMMACSLLCCTTGTNSFTPAFALAMVSHSALLKDGEPHGYKLLGDLHGDCEALIRMDLDDLLIC